jgi:hypothetical protein
MDNIVLASTYRLTAANFRLSAEVLYEKFLERGETLPNNIRAIPFYFLVSHAAELLLKCALLKRGISQAQLKQYELGHNLDSLLKCLMDLGVSISPEAVALVTRLSTDHKKHALRYTALLDDGEPTFTPEPVDLFKVLDELLMAGRTSRA